jgi:hypothetical protein
MSVRRGRVVGSPARGQSFVAVLFVDDADEFVVDAHPGVVAVAGGVVALASQDGHELGVGLEEAAALADCLEPTVALSGAGAVPVGEQPRVRWRVVDGGPGGEGGGRRLSTALVALKYCSATVVSAMRDRRGSSVVSGVRRRGPERTATTRRPTAGLAELVCARGGQARFDHHERGVCGDSER